MEISYLSQLSHENWQCIVGVLNFKFFFCSYASSLLQHLIDRPGLVFGSALLFPLLLRTGIDKATSVCQSENVELLMIPYAVDWFDGLKLAPRGLGVLFCR